MKTTVKLEEALLLDAMKEMRKTYKSNLTDEVKEERLHHQFYGAMKLLDDAGVK